MANAIYPIYKQSLLDQDGANWDIDDPPAAGVKVALVTAGYTYNAAHDFYNDITPGSNVVGTPQVLANTTVTNGLFDADNVTFTAVSGSQVTALVIFIENAGANTTWPLVAYIDTGQTGLPVTPNGGDITITWNASGIFQL